MGPESRKLFNTGELANAVDDSNVCKYDLNVSLFFSLANLDACPCPCPKPDIDPGEPTEYPEYAEYVGLVGLPPAADAESKLVVLPVLSVRYIPGIDIDIDIEVDGPALFCRGF